MAVNKKSLLLNSISGRLGDVIIKQYRYGAVISKIPDMSKAGCTARQKASRTRFKKAVAFAKAVLADEDERKRYKRMRGKGSAYNKAITDFLKRNKPGK